MPQFLGTLTPIVLGLNTVQGFPQAGLRAIIIGNDSGFNVVVRVGGTSNSKTIYPGSVDIIYLPDGFNGNLDFLATSPLSNQTSWPGNYLQFDGVGIQEKINEAAYPLTLNRAVNTGNPTSSTVTNFLQSDNAPLGTQFIEVTPAAAPGSTFSFLNDGTVIIKGDVAAVLTTLLQLVPAAAAGASSVILGDITRTVETLGNLRVDGGINSQVVVAVGNGSTSGTVTLIQDCIGKVKRVYGIMVNFRNGGGSNLVVALPTAFTTGALVTTGLTGTSAQNADILLTAGGVSQNVNIVNAFSATGSSFFVAQTSIYQGQLAECQTAFDSVAFKSGGTAAHGGHFRIEGQ